MAKGAVIQVRVDKETKSKVKSILDALGLQLSDAVCLYLRQIVIHRGIPFELKIPNKLTAQTLAKSEQGLDVHEARSVDELFKELDA